MNDNWMEIVYTLQPYIECNSIEPKYQQEIENCLKFLGWKSYNKTMQSQVSINIGNNNSIRPDIVFYWMRCRKDIVFPRRTHSLY